MTRLTCAECVTECRQQGGLCNPSLPEEREALREMGISESDEASARKTCANSHLMTVVGAQYVCGQDHRLEATGTAVMEASGAKRLL